MPFEVGVSLGADGVEPVREGPSGQADIAHLEMRLVGRQQQTVLARQTLRLVDGDRVAVSQPPFVEILLMKPAKSVGRVEEHASVLVVDRDDLADRAVADLALVVVAEAHDGVADLEWPLADDDRFALELMGFGEESACPSVEVVDVDVTVRHHQRVAATLAVAPPLVDHPLSHNIGIGPGHERPMPAQPGDRLLDSHRPVVVECLAFPRHLLSPVFGERDDRVSVFKRTEHTPGVDLGKLLGVADEDDLRSRRCRLVDQWREGSGADHACFVDDEHRLGVEPIVVAAQVDLEHRDGGRADTRTGLELVRGSGGERAADDAVAGVSPCLSRGVEAERFAGARPGDHHVDRVTRCRDVHDRLTLFPAHRRSIIEGPDHGVLVRGRRSRAESVVALPQHLGFERDELRCRISIAASFGFGERDDIGLLEIVVREVEHHRGRHAGREFVEEPADHVAPIERRCPLGQTLR